MASADKGLRIFTLHGTYKYLHHGGKIIDSVGTEFFTAQEENKTAFCTTMCFVTIHCTTIIPERREREERRWKGERDGGLRV